MKNKYVEQIVALSIALMKILDTTGIPIKKCSFPSNLPQYAINDKKGVINEDETKINW